jgi:hypothetical protein
MNDHEESVGQDLLEGASAIASFLNKDKRRTLYQLQRGQIPAGKAGRIWQASKSALRSKHIKVTSGETPRE